MKIGFSFGRCVRDIVTGVVSIDDIVVIVARTRMETVDHLLGVCDQYAHDAFYGLDLDECKVVATALFNSGKLHQPRIHGGWPGGVADRYVWMDVMPTSKDTNPAIQEAWDNYRMLLTMCADVPLPDGTAAPVN